MAGEKSKSFMRLAKRVSYLSSYPGSFIVLCPI